MEFYAALSVSRDQVRKTASRLIDRYGSIEPLQNIIFTPIATGDTTHESIHELNVQYDLSIMYDSGGYEVQTGNLDFDELLKYLINYYEDHQNAHRYVLPDNVPISGDSTETVDRKVDETISASRTCFKRLPDSVRNRAVGVVQGHNQDQLARCLKAYEELDIGTIAFGSFGTGGKNQGVNMLTTEALENLQWAVDRADEYDMEIHALGIGGPTSIPLLKEAGVDSFDSSAWIRSSGYGNVFFPFKSRFNASHRKVRSGAVLRSDELEDLKEETNHRCPFCQSIGQLRDSRWARIIHNLIVLHEMSIRIEEMDQSEMLEAMDNSSTYRSRLEAM